MRPFEKALEIAVRAHADAVDKAGKPYILHVMRVVAAVVDEGEDAMQVAVLHDVLEDSDISEEELRREFADHVVDAVVAITHRRHEERKSYLDRVRSNPLALMVKRADILDNYGRLAFLKDDATRERLRKKYEFAAGYLGMTWPGGS